MLGKTKVKTRICEDEFSIRNYEDKSSVASHFSSYNDSLSELQYMGRETVKMPQREVVIGTESFSKGGVLDTLPCFPHS